MRLFSLVGTYRWPLVGWRPRATHSVPVPVPVPVPVDVCGPFSSPSSPSRSQPQTSLPTAGGTILYTQWQRIYDELFEADWAAARVIHGDDTCVTNLARTVSQRRADALVELARRASAFQAGTSVAARPLVTILVHAPDLMGPLRETFNGVVLSRRDVAEWLSEADFERIIFDPTGRPVNMTSPARFFTGPMRRAVQIRDQVCSHPTCDVDAERCQVDHIIEHTNGGPTNIDNARLLCPKHNQQRPGRTKKPDNRNQDDDGDGDGDGGGDGDGDGDADRDTDRDTDGDTDGDADRDTDGDTDGDTDRDTDGDTGGNTDRDV